MPSAFVARFFAFAIALFSFSPCFAADAQKPAPSAAFSAGMTRLAFLHGDWNVQPWQRSGKGSDLAALTPYSMAFRPILSDRYLRAGGNQMGTDFEITVSFDERTGMYRLSLIDSVSGVLDVYQGQFLPTGQLQLENGNGWRFEFNPGQESGWVLQNYYSKDEGKTWLLTGKYLFSRP